MIAIWDVKGAEPILVDSVIVSGASTLGDVAISDDGKLLVVATERSNGSLVDLRPHESAHPIQLSRDSPRRRRSTAFTPLRSGAIAGRLYAILAIDPLSGAPTPESKIVIVDLGDPANPQQIYVKPVPNTAPFVHDTFLRDGLLFVALWNAGIEIWDVGRRRAGRDAKRARRRRVAWRPSAVTRTTSGGCTMR